MFSDKGFVERKVIFRGKSRFFTENKWGSSNRKWEIKRRFKKKSDRIGLRHREIKISSREIKIRKREENRRNLERKRIINFAGLREWKESRARKCVFENADGIIKQGYLETRWGEWWGIKEGTGLRRKKLFVAKWGE